MTKMAGVSSNPSDRHFSLQHFVRQHKDGAFSDAPSDIRQFLAAEAKHYRELFDLAPDSYLITDAHGLLQEANRAAIRLLNTEQSSLYNKPLITFIASQERIAFRTQLAKLVQLKNVQCWETVLQPHHRHSPVTVSITACVIQGSDHDPVRLCWQIRDITHLQQTLDTAHEAYERQLKQQNEELAILSQYLVEARELERRRIARELHDEIGQSLSLLKFTLKRIEDEVQVPNRGFQEAQDSLDRLIGQARNLSLRLLPTMLDNLGLLDTLEWHFQHYTEQTNIEVEFIHNKLQQRFSQDVELAAYRIIQESLTNVSRHAEVQQVTVIVSASKNNLRIDIRDAGRGFDIQAVHTRNRDTSNPKKHIGLLGMVRRAELVDGTFEVTSTPGKGTVIKVHIPLKSSKS